MDNKMRISEFQELVDFIRAQCFLCNEKGYRAIKYVVPHIDMRIGGDIYAVKFIEWLGEKHLVHTQNDCKDLEESLFDRCMKYLKNKPTPYLTIKRR